MSARDRRVRDFVGIELQTLDTTGTVWPERQRFLKSHEITVDAAHAASQKSFGMNWKMTAKTTLVQLHHKVETFEAVGKHLVLVLQDRLLQYMRKEFSFGHLADPARGGDPMQFHGYRLTPSGDELELELDQRASTDAAGVAACLGMQIDARVELEHLVAALERHLNDATLLTL